MVADALSACPTPTRLVAMDGVALSIERRIGHRSPTLLFAHGFGQTRHAWTGAAVALAEQGFGSVAVLRVDPRDDPCDDPFDDPFRQHGTLSTPPQLQSG